MLKIEINNKIVSANKGEMLIAVTDREGINVPRFCYHKKLSIAANCRMCLVDIEGSPSPQPACCTPISEGMKVNTNNKKTKTSQQAVMEFLLINHPLDCPICDQGGECELQDVAMSYGSDVSYFNEGKRIVADKDIGPLIQTDMTRCIHCTRCVRFGVEVAGIMEMGGTGRGENLKIEPFLKEGINSELSGNMIDVCPVGALTSKPFRYELRSWQMNSIPNIARHDLVGSNIYTQIYKNKVKRVVAKDNDNINETWISDRDRFSYEGLSSENRLLKAQIKVEGELREVEWNVALDFAIRGLKKHIINNNQANRLGALASNTANLEEFYLLKKLLKELGSENLDYRLNVKNPDDFVSPKSNIKLKELENIDYAIVIGSNPRLEQPMINNRLRKAVLAGAIIDVINVMEFDFNYELNSENIISANDIAGTLASVLCSIINNKAESLPDYLKNIKTSTLAKDLANKLINANNPVIIIGEHIINNYQISNIVNLITEITEKTNSSTLYITNTANSMAADLVGFIPSKNGLDVNSMLESSLKAYILLDIYPDYDFYDSLNAVDKLKNDDTFIIALNSFKDEKVAQYSDVILPIANFYETPGSHVNIDSNIQSFKAAVNPIDNAKPAWKILKALADLLELSDFDYTNCSQITNEIKQYNYKSQENNKIIDLKPENNEISIIKQKSHYANDALLRNAKSLQKTNLGKINNAFMNYKVAKKLKLKDGQNYLDSEVVITDKIADDCVFINMNKIKNKI
jgi:NADH-quinone oxidoreductase subunit G